MSGITMRLFRFCAVAFVLQLLDEGRFVVASTEDSNTTDDDSGNTDNSGSGDDNGILVDVSTNNTTTRGSEPESDSSTSGSSESSEEVTVPQSEYNNSGESNATAGGSGSDIASKTTTAAGSSVSTSASVTSDTSTQLVTTATATTTSIAVTVSTAVMALSSVDDFDQEAYIRSMASSTGIDESQVKIKSVDFMVNVQYQFDAAVDKDTFATAISNIMQVPENAVSVSIAARRLSASTHIRRLAVVMDVTITTSKASDVAGLTAKATETGSLETELAAVSSTPVRLTVTKQPTLSVKVVTELSSTDGVEVTGPTAADLSRFYKDNTGKDLKITTVTDFDVITVNPGTNTTTSGDDEEASGCGRISPTFTCAVVALLSTAILA